MNRITTIEQKSNLAELALSMAMSGKSWDEFTDSVADKVANRLIGIFPDKREVSPCATDEKPLRGVRALCRHYGISTATLNKMMKADKIPFRQVGNRYLFYPSEVDVALKGGAAV
ncbi:helix-turn-helix domain-containing protein [Bacteroides acidifaciens]|jgi:hypothetical protein|uniref:helix-turn-helix domain-containing protein n=1 Tax=Bacteroides acidifaciens TaxID=85831 RepID=UPI0030144633